MHSHREDELSRITVAIRSVAVRIAAQPDIADDFAAAFDFQLSEPDGACDAAGSADDQDIAGGQRAVKLAADFGYVDGCLLYTSDAADALL